MNTPNIYPWQQAQWDAFMMRWHQKNLPHALLLHGEDGVGVENFSECLVRTLLCLGENKPCGNCRTCKLYTGSNNPDFYKIGVEKEDGEIKIKQIRELIPFLQVPRHYNMLKIALIQNADLMNYAAASSLLKMLEEPPEHVLIVLTSHHPFRMLATVRSRCQTIHLRSPNQRQSCIWLAKACDISESEAKRRLISCSWRPIHALEVTKSLTREDFYKDVNELIKKQTTLIELTKKWQEQPVNAVHQWLLEATENAITREFKNEGGLPLHKLFSFYDRQKYRYLSTKVRLNPRLLLESALIEWQRAHPVEINFP